MTTSLATLPKAAPLDIRKIKPGGFLAWHAREAHKASMYFRSRPKRRKPMPEGIL